MNEPLPQPTEDALRARIRELEATVEQMTAAAGYAAAKAASKLQNAASKLHVAETERDALRRNYELLREQHELLKRRVYLAKAERLDVRQLEIEFAAQQKRLDAMAAELGLPATPPAPPPPAPGAKKKTGRPSKGRRDLHALDLPEERIQLLDPELEATAQRISFEESCRYGWRRGGPIRIVVARAIYKLSKDERLAGDASDSPAATLYTVPVPKELLRRPLCAPSMLAHLLHAKYGLGLPFYRLEAELAAAGAPLDRGSMSRMAEDAGATLAAIVEAMAADARANAFCLSTDATGVAIQPTPLPDKSRQPCRKGHFFVVLADRDHVFFEYRAKHDSAAVCEMFRGYSGYIQADAHAIYDALFRGEAVDDGAAPPIEVACWAHARRKFWEAACARHALGREGVLRLHRVFELDASWQDKPPDARRTLRQTKLRPFMDDFFAWAQQGHDAHKGQRGSVPNAFGYAIRQRDALRRVLEDGRLKLTNNGSERALRPIASGRKAWLFFGSDDHASAAANLFSLIASCRLHTLEPELYLRDVMRVMPHWPRDRYLELAPKFWRETRAKLVPKQLTDEVGPLDVPPPSTAQEPTAR
jgi:hypothetical protein